MKNILFLCTTDSMIWNFLVEHIKRLETEGCTVECAASETGFYFKELRQKGITMHRIPFERSPYSARNIKAYKELCKLVSQNKYDIIFCHEPVGGAFGRIVGKKYGCKVVYMAHGFHFYKGAPATTTIYYLVEKKLSRKTDLLITINREDFEASQKFHATKIALVNGIGVDTNKFVKKDSDYLRRELHLKDDSLILLSVGELIPRKNHLTVIKSLVNFKNVDVHYFIAGEGELESRLKCEVEELGLKDQVHFLGFCRNVNELCNSCDIFIMPSVHEGLSLALMEAMACGKPVIASKIRGNVDLIEDTKGGLLVDTYDEVGYYKAIDRLWRSSDLMASMSRVNLENIKKYDISVIKEELVELLLG